MWTFFWNIILVCQQRVGQVFLSFFVDEKYFWKIICLCCTGWLLLQVIVDFFIVKPTFSAVENSKLSQIYFPDIVVCLENGFDQKQLKLYDYDTSLLYFLGRSGRDKFIGWSGKENTDQFRRNSINYCYFLNKHLCNNKQFQTNIYVRLIFLKSVHIKVISKNQKAHYF